MSIQPKKSGAYASAIDELVKRNIAYSSVQDIYAKVNGAYQSVLSGFVGILVTRPNSGWGYDGGTRTITNVLTIPASGSSIVGTVMTIGGSMGSGNGGSTNGRVGTLVYSSNAATPVPEGTYVASITSGAFRSGVAAVCVLQLANYNGTDLSGLNVAGADMKFGAAVCYTICYKNVSDCNNLKALFHNFKMNTGNLIPQDADYASTAGLTFRGSWELPNSSAVRTIYPITFNGGETSVTFAGGTIASEWTDPIDVGYNIPAGTVCTLHVEVTNSDGISPFDVGIGTNNMNNFTTVEGQIYTKGISGFLSSDATWGGASAYKATTFMWKPVAILAETVVEDAKSVRNVDIIGNSITSNPSGWWHIFGSDQDIPYNNLAKSGDAPNCFPVNAAGRVLGSYARTAIVGLATNELSSNLITDQQAVIATLRGLGYQRIIGVACTPNNPGTALQITSGSITAGILTIVSLSGSQAVEAGMAIKGTGVPANVLSTSDTAIAAFGTSGTTGTGGVGTYALTTNGGAYTGSDSVNPTFDTWKSLNNNTQLASINFRVAYNTWGATNAGAGPEYFDKWWDFLPAISTNNRWNAFDNSSGDGIHIGTFGIAGTMAQNKAYFTQANILAYLIAQNYIDDLTY